MEEDKKQGSEVQNEAQGRTQAKKESGGLASILTNKFVLIGGGIAVLAIVVIALFLTGKIGAKAAASVNGEKILLSQVDKEYKTYESQYSKNNGNKKPDKKMQTEIKKLILDRLVQQELISQAAEKEGVKVAKKEIDERVDQIKKSTSKKQLEDTLKQMNWTMDDLRNMVEVQILQTKVREKITKGIKVTDKDAEKYYDENKKNYDVPDTVKAKIATLKKKEEADKLAADVSGGTDFDKAVKKYIKGGVTAQQLGKDQITGIYGEELANAAFKLDEGGTTGVVKTKNGYYVAKVEKKEKGRQKTYKEVKEEVKSMLLSQKQMEKFNTWTQDLKKEAKITIFIKELKTSGKLPSSHP